MQKVKLIFLGAKIKEYKEDLVPWEKTGGKTNMYFPAEATEAPDHSL